MSNEFDNFVDGLGDDIGQKISQTIDSAVNSKNFENLSQTISKAIDTAIDSFSATGYKNPSKTVNNPTYRDTYTNYRKVDKNGRPITSQPQTNAAQAPQSKPEPKYLWNKSPSGTGIAIVKVAIGFTMLAMFGVGGIVFAVLAGIGLTGIAVPIVFGALAVVGLLLGLNGVKFLKLLSHFRKITARVKQVAYVKIADLAKQTGIDQNTLAKDIGEMITKKWFFEAHLDQEAGYFITTEDAYKSYLGYKDDYYKNQKIIREKEAKLGENKELRAVMEAGEMYINKIHDCNEKIPDAAMSDKLDVMENMVRKIFAEVELHPEKAGDLRRLMNYYLPTTSKLLDAYIDLDASNGTGENITNSKKEISDTIDTLNVAFEKLFDDLFAAEALDISSDISVLNTMLAREGLKEDGLMTSN